MLENANNLRNMPKIKVFIEKNEEKWLRRIENWVHSCEISGAEFFYDVNTEKCYFMNQKLI